MHTVIKNPFYYGVMRVKGNFYPHIYEPLISKDTFDRCQQVQKYRSKKQKQKTRRYPFLYRGMFRCAVTGKMISCDLKKNRYTYLIATNPDDVSRKIYVREEKITAYIERKLRKISLPDEQFKSLIQYVKASLQSKKRTDDQQMIKLHRERDEIQKQLDRLTDLLIKDRISQDAYDRKHAELRMKHSEISIAILDKPENDGEMLETSIITILYLCKNAQKIFKSSKKQLKCYLLKTLFSNCELNGEKPRCAIVTPLSLMLKKRET